ncbi:MAG: archaellin/type IV pilin N-terminal domain-containing protein [Candidatus Woesearchaeota archaeon]
MKIMKKAVSPLIATILLISLAVALGSIIINFSQKTTLELSESASDNIEIKVNCKNIIYRLVDINKNPCYNRSFSKNFEVVLENQGNLDSEGTIITIFDFDSNPYTTKILEKLSSNNRTKYNISLDENFKLPPIKIIISPVLSYNKNKLNTCNDNRIEIEEIDRC